MEQHQTRKVEIDAREDSFQNVVKMGKDLIARNHYATPEVKKMMSSFQLSLPSFHTLGESQKRVQNG